MRFYTKQDTFSCGIDQHARALPESFLKAIPFVLDHTLTVKAIHGGKSKNDKIDSQKIATLLRRGTLRVASLYPRTMRSTRDLLRRRAKLQIPAGPVELLIKGVTRAAPVTSTDAHPERTIKTFH